MKILITFFATILSIAICLIVDRVEWNEYSKGMTEEEKKHSIKDG